MENWQFEAKREFARSLDEADALKAFRDRFYFPEGENGQSKRYFCGNSLGLQPRSVADYLQTELEDWRKMAVDAHFHGQNPWFHYHKFFTKSLSRLTGAHEHEVVAMNTLTVNLHLMMVSFYQPSPKRNKILIEEGAFPSDQFAVESQVVYHGFDPKEAIIPVNSRVGEHTLRNDDILQAIADNRDELALVLLPGVQFYSGQFLDVPAITYAAHEVGAFAGFDLAHAIGNVPLRLHDWEVDFAVWCSYKYLNSGPGGVGGAFVHENYADKEMPRFAGWWGHDEESRFGVNKSFKPEYGASGWQLSNAQVLSMAAHRASLDIFDEAGFESLHAKSHDLTAYLAFLLEQVKKKGSSDYEIITPEDPNKRGAQLSLLIHNQAHDLYKKIIQKEAVVDYREPNVIRVAPVPLYNTFEEVFDFAEILGKYFNRD